ncbi:hypothetical protein NDU88_002483 [Pleurodeles waltl]|uniref:Uncharacterized protein n=1 Tax=Pleurodeles waltl TaxID=8319 RepID=A0AAV7MMV9_PLEWA|nr:hypothetical protein NDU88_002483 [Pleurodeles waltl]
MWSWARPSPGPQPHGGPRPDNITKGPPQPAPPLTSCRRGRRENPCPAPPVVARQPGALSAPLRLRPGQTPAGPTAPHRLPRPRSIHKSLRPEGAPPAPPNQEKLRILAPSRAEPHAVTAILPGG